MPEGKPEFDVFLSYKSEERAWVRSLKAALQTRGLRVWLDCDEILPGDRVVGALEHGLESCRSVALVVTPEALESGWVQDEYHRAVALGNTKGRELRVIPIILREAALPGFLSNRQWVSFCDGSRFDDCVSRLCAGITGKRPEDFPASAASALVSLSKLPVTSPDLFGREKELAILDAAWDDPATSILTVIAFGGIGKSALVNTWLSQIKEDGYRGARRVFGWSFYSQGTHETATSSDTFINEALTWFGDPEPHPIDVWQRVQRLVSLLRAQPTLLILDGLEPLQSSAVGELGQVKDIALRYLLKELAREMNGLCVVSSRVPIADLSASEDSGPVRLLSLDRLSTGAGQQLLRHHKIKGLDAELDAAVDEYEGHALALTLLATHLAKFGKHDIARRKDLPVLGEGDPDDPNNRQAFRMLKAYDASFAEAGRAVERTVLRLLGLFDRPASADCLAALREPPAIPGVTDSVVGLRDREWRRVITRLRDLRLLSRPEADQDDGSLDAHPLLREYFGPKLETESPDGFREAHSRLFDCLCQATKKDLPDTLEEMQPLLQAVHHGCRAGRHREALDEVYNRRIQRGEEFYCRKRLGAVGQLLAAVSGFFTERWTVPASDLGLHQQGDVLNYAGFYLQLLGRSKEASVPLEKCLDTRLSAGDWRRAAESADILVDFLLASGQVGRAAAMGRRAVLLAEKSGDGHRRITARAYLASVAHCQCHLRPARALFEEAEHMQQEDQTNCALLNSLRGAQYAALLIDLGEADRVLKRAQQILTWDREHGIGFLAVALGSLNLGRACGLLVPSRPDPFDLDLKTEARSNLDQAVQSVHSAGVQDELPKALLPRASFLRDTGDRPGALRDLHEALDLSERCGFRLHETDARLLAGHLALDPGGTGSPGRAERGRGACPHVPDVAAAHASLARATTLVAETGYHLRDADLLILEGRLLGKQGDPTAARAKLDEAIQVAKREEADGCIYQVALDQAHRYLRELAGESVVPLW